MRKKGLNLVFLLMMAIMIITLPGCSKTTHKIYESGFFEYVIIGKTSRFPKNKADEGVAIVRLTELGQEQETIDIPRMIDGKEVWYIGFRIIRGGLMVGNRPYPFFSPNLKKMYIHENIIGIDDEVFHSNGEEWDVMLCSTSYKHDLDWPIYNIDLDFIAITVPGNIYIYKFLYDKTVEELRQLGISNPAYGDKILPANIAFLNNYSNEINGGYYMLDNIKTGERIPQPPSPEREGYMFTGWFTDTECTNVWNFDNEKEIESGEEFRLYAGWKQQ